MGRTTSSPLCAGPASAVALAASLVQSVRAHGGEDHGGAVPEKSAAEEHAANVAAALAASNTTDMFTIGYIPFGQPPPIVRDDPDMCFNGCNTALRGPAYADVAPDASFLYKQCHSRLMQTSIFLCLRANCYDAHAAPGEYDLASLAGVVRLNDTCSQYMDTPLPSVAAILDGYTDDVVVRLRRLQRYESDPTTNLTAPVVTSEQLYENSYDTLASWQYVHHHHLGYAHLMFFFWMAVVLFGTFARLGSFLVRRVQRARRRWRGSLSVPGRGRGLYARLSDDALAAASVADADQEERLFDVNIDQADSAVVPEAESTLQRILSRPNVWLQRYVVLPATFGFKCAQDFGWYTVPPRVQTLTITAFAMINVYACFTGYRVFTGNMWWPQISRQYYRYVSDRTGILSFVNFPLIWLFGMRNNFLLWLTGWDFGTYNNFHRWIARVATVQAIVHSIGYTILVCLDGGWHEFLVWWQLFWWWTGGVATILMSLLLGLSAFWMRRHVYELFLIIHIVFSIFILLGMVGHVSIFRGTYDMFWRVPAYIWILDRVMRVTRVLAFNPLFWRTKAKVSYDPNSNIVRLAVPYSSSLYTPQPGTYYYLHVLNDKRFWESHPFTVATVASPSSGSLAFAEGKARKTAALELADTLPPPTGSESHTTTDDSPYTPVDPQHKSTGLLRGTTYGINQSYDKLQCSKDSEDGNGETGDDDDKNHESPRPSTSDSALSVTSALSAISVPPSTPAHAADALTFLIRPYDGFTARLRDRAAGTTGDKPAFTRLASDDSTAADALDSAQAPPATVRVLVDGPYGHAHRFDDGSYGSALFIVGGSGIVVPMSHLTGIGHDRMAAGFTSKEDPNRLRSVHIVWAVREAEFAAGVLREDLHSIFDAQHLTGVRVSLDIYVTRGDTESVLASLGIDQVRVFSGRPDVRGEIACASNRDAARGRVAVVACGPGRMADEARRAVVDLIGRRGTASDIEYVEESFQW